METPQTPAPLPRRYRSAQSPALGERGLGCPAQLRLLNPWVIGRCPNRGLTQLLSPLSPSLPQFPQCLGKLQPCVSSPEQDSMRHPHSGRTSASHHHQFVSTDWQAGPSLSLWGSSAGFKVSFLKNHRGNPSPPVNRVM